MAKNKKAKVEAVKVEEPKVEVTVTQTTGKEKVKKVTVRSLIVEKVMEGKLTDSAILDLVMKTFPGWTLEGKKHYVSWYRWDLGRKGVKDVPAAVKEPKPVKAEVAA